MIKGAKRQRAGAKQKETEVKRSGTKSGYAIDS
jgi:hypothetical protein